MEKACAQGIEAGVKVFGSLLGLDGGGGDLFFFGDVVHAHERARIADIFGGLLIFLDQDIQDTEVALDRGVLAFGHHVGDLWLFFLSVAVDPSVALLKDHERPRDIEVDQTVGKIMKVDPFGGDIGGDKDTDRHLFLAEDFHDFLLSGIGHTAVHFKDLIFGWIGWVGDLEPEVKGELLIEKGQTFAAFGKENHAVGRVFGVPML